jgi:FAD-dependent sensor of blue light
VLPLGMVERLKEHSSMHFLIYTSTASSLMSDLELTDLLALCRDRNSQDELTGMLLYKDGSFMQVLEGEKAIVLRTFARIQKDTRHKDIFLLREREMESRNFNGWSMGFKSVKASDLRDKPGFSDLSEELFSSCAYSEKPHIALKLLKSFHENTR